MQVKITCAFRFLTFVIIPTVLAAVGEAYIVHKQEPVQIHMVSYMVGYHPVPYVSLHSEGSTTIVCACGQGRWTLSSRPELAWR